MLRIPKVLLLVESSCASGRAMLNGIASYARYHGPWSFYWEPGGLKKVGSKLKTLDVDGIILRDVDRLREIHSLGIPAVVVGHIRKEIPGLVNVVTHLALATVG
jgi:LacI family transcriptional regulator